MILAASNSDILHDTIILFISLLAVVAQVFIVAVVLVRLAAQFNPRARIFFDAATTRIKFLTLPLAWVVGVVATSGSLFFSRGLGWTPCDLCWYQRTMIYPQAIILGVATFRRRATDVIPYSIGLAIVALVISSYHVLVEWFPNFESEGICSKQNISCTQVWLKEFGYLGIPMMAGTASLLIITLLLLNRRAASLRAVESTESVSSN